MRDNKLTKARKNFINYYIEQDFKNASQAYQRAYPKASYETARANAPKLLAKTNIQEYLSETLAEILKREKLPLEKRIFNFWVKRAFYDFTEIIGLDGHPKLTEEELRERGLEVCIDAIEREEKAGGIVNIQYRLADKNKAVEMLEKYIQMLKPVTSKLEVKAEIDVTAMTPEQRDARIVELLQKTGYVKPDEP